MNGGSWGWRAASPPRRCPTEARHAWQNYRGEEKKEKKSLGTFALEAGVALLCRNESCLLLSALRPHTHSHLVQPQHHGSCALPPARDVRGGAAGDAQLHN